MRKKYLCYMLQTYTKNCCLDTFKMYPKFFANIFMLIILGTKSFYCNYFNLKLGKELGLLALLA